MLKIFEYMATVGARLRQHIMGYISTFHILELLTVGLGRHTLHAIAGEGRISSSYDYLLNSTEHKTRILTFDRLVLFVLNYPK